jgi:hypothetical protein
VLCWPDFAEVMSGRGEFRARRVRQRGARLATAIDGYHRGHTVRFLTDASAGHALDEIGANDVHRVVGLYCEVLATQNWIMRTSRTSQWRGVGDGNEKGRTA